MSAWKDNLSDEFEPDFLPRKARERAHSSEQAEKRNITPMMQQIINCFGGKPIQAKGGAHIIQLPKSFLNEAEKAMRCRKLIEEEDTITWEWKKTGTKKRMKSVSKHRNFKNRSLA